MRLKSNINLFAFSSPPLLQLMMIFFESFQPDIFLVIDNIIEYIVVLGKNNIHILNRQFVIKIFFNFHVIFFNISFYVWFCLHFSFGVFFKNIL